MLTTKEFKAKYGISDAAFTRYTNAAKKLREGAEVTAREGSKTWIITDLEAILAVMPSEVKRRVEQADQAVTAEITEDRPLLALPAYRRAESASEDSELNAEVLSIRIQESSSQISSMSDVVRHWRGQLDQFRSGYISYLETDVEQLETEVEQLECFATELDETARLVAEAETRAQVRRQDAERRKQEAAKKVAKKQKAVLQKASQ